MGVSIYKILFSCLNSELRNKKKNQQMKNEILVKLVFYWDKNSHTIKFSIFKVQFGGFILKVFIYKVVQLSLLSNSRTFSSCQKQPVSSHSSPPSSTRSISWQPLICFPSLGFASSEIFVWMESYNSGF